MNALLTNGKGVTINNKNIDEEKQELNEVRNKILSRVALKNANNMMVNGELLMNGSSSEHSDDIKFIDSDSDNLSDKRTSPLNNGGVDANGGSLNNLAAAPNHITKMLAASTPVNSTTMTRNTTTLNKTNTYPPKPTKTNILPTQQNNVIISPSNKKLILNASPKNSCVYEKQQQKQNLLQKLSITNTTTSENNHHPHHANPSSKMEHGTVSLNAGTHRLRIITSSNDTDDDDDFTNVSTTATIILPSKASTAKQNGVQKSNSVGGETIVANNHDHKDNSSDASTIILEKKNLANHKQISDTNDTSVSSPI